MGDSSDYFFQNSQLVLDRENTVIVAEFSQLQRLLGGKLLLKSSMDWIQIVTALSAQPIMASLITKHEDQVLVVAEQRLSSTQSSASLQAIASYASVWSLQQPSKPFQALTTAVYCASQT